MTQENGGEQITDGKNGSNNNANEQNGSQTDVQKQIDDLQAVIDTLKKESAGKDRKIQEYLKQQELSNLSQKTDKEQLEAYKLKAEQYERKEAYRQSFKEVGLNPDEFESIIDEKDAKLQAEKFAKLLKDKADSEVKKALEEFKKKELETKGGTPNPKDSNTQKYANVNDAIRNAFKK